MPRFENNKYFTDEYVRKGILGQGAHAKIYKCQSRKNATNWAVKIMEKRVLKKGHTQRYIQEINVMKDLDHPNVIKVHEFF
jgi:calcium-dependent protein kinase